MIEIHNINEINATLLYVREGGKHMKKIRIILMAVCMVMALCATAMAAPNVSVETKLFKSGGLTVVYPEVTVEGKSTVSNLINLYFENELDALQVNNEEAYERDLDTLGKKSERHVYSLSYCSDKYICFVDKGDYYYAKTAYPTEWTKGVTFDLDTGYVVQWAEIIRPVDQNVFLLKGINQRLVSSDTEQGRILAKVDGFKGINDWPSQFYLDKEGYIHFTFVRGEIAPAAVGVIDLNMGKRCND